MELMNAVRLHEYGGPGVLNYEEAPVPKLEPEDVLVEVHAAGVNPVDWKVREGHLKDGLHHQLPLIPGWDVSGRVVARGSQVSELNEGDEVYGRPDISRDGCYAEYVAVRASELAPKPRNLSHAEAAAVPLAGLTAWQALFEAMDPYQSAGLQPEQRILIHGAAGGVGSFAVQLARWRGAYVIGTGSANSAELLSKIGSHEFINYETAPFDEAVKDIDVVFDTIGGATQERSWRVLKPGGTLVSIVSPPSEDLARQHRANAAYVFVQPNRDHLVSLSELIESHSIRPVLAATLPLSKVRRAHERSQSGHTHGKLVLTVHG